MKLMIIGAGGYGRVVADIASQLNRYESIKFLDDNSTESDVIGKCADYQMYIDEKTEVYPAFGNNDLRLQWIEKLLNEGITVPILTHSTAYVSPTALLAVGTVVLPKAVINSYTVVEQGCIINMGALIDHNCVIGAGSHICLGAIIKADNYLPECVKIEAGTVIQNGTYKKER